MYECEHVCKYDKRVWEAHAQGSPAWYIIFPDMPSGLLQHYWFLTKSFLDQLNSTTYMYKQLSFYL